MNTALLIGVIASSIMSGTSLLYATLGEVVGERAGIVNLGLEGIMLIGAASGFAATVLTGSPYLGVVAAALAGAAANLIFAYLVVGRHANQLATGLSLMFFGIGMSALIGRPFVGALINGLPRLVVPGLAPGGAGARLARAPLVGGGGAAAPGGLAAGTGAPGGLGVGVEGEEERGEEVRLRGWC